MAACRCDVHIILCAAPATQEDLLCDMCRDGLCLLITIDGSLTHAGYDEVKKRLEGLTGKRLRDGLLPDRWRDPAVCGNRLRVLRRRARLVAVE
jgi:hypothetical protein